MQIDTQAKNNFLQARRIMRLLFGLGISFFMLELVVGSVIEIGINAGVPFIRVPDWIGPVLLIVLGFEVAVLFLSLRLARTGSAQFPRAWAYIGMAVYITGIWLDVLSTVVGTPDLAHEGNLYIVFGLRFHMPVLALYALAFFAQLGLTVLSCALWLSFLRHHRTLLNIIWSMGPKGLIQFLWVSLGGNLASTKSLPNPELYDRSYRLVWPVVLCLTEPISRFYLGLQWVGIDLNFTLVPFKGPVASLFIDYPIELVGCLYVGWLVYCFFTQRPSSIEMAG